MAIKYVQFSIKPITEIKTYQKKYEKIIRNVKKRKQNNVNEQQEQKKMEIILIIIQWNKLSIFYLLKKDIKEKNIQNSLGIKNTKKKNNNKEIFKKANNKIVYES